MAMSILSFGIFNSYWMYKNWQFLKNRDNLDIMPFWRGIFGIFFIHSLLNKIEADKGLSEVERSNFSGSTLATIWVVLLISSNLLSRLDDTNTSGIASLISIFAGLCFLPVQVYINRVNNLVNSQMGESPWSFGQILCLLIGMPLVILEAMSFL